MMTKGITKVYDNQRRIGITLSGGGIRAAVFHLGTLKWLAENNMLEDIARISSVSGAGLGIGLVYAQNGHRWPTSEEYLKNVLPKVKKVILHKDILHTAIKRLIFSPWWWHKRVNLMAKILQKHWGLIGDLTDLGKNPLWFINCTTYETGKRFRFSQEDMGDYRIGYVRNPKIALADAVAASAGLPVFIGPYKMKTDKYQWEKSYFSKDDSVTVEKYIHLWDGGVYDNLGMESVYKPDNGGSLCEGIDYLVVSNASMPIEYKTREKNMSGKNLKRLLEIAMDQVMALRNRSVMDYFKRAKKGVYYKIGNSAQDIVEDSKLPPALKKELIAQCLSAEDAQRACDYPTTLSKPTEADFELLLRHGYEVAKCTSICYDPECTVFSKRCEVYI